jgi:hypothetical protein
MHQPAPAADGRNPQERRADRVEQRVGLECKVA